MVQPPSSKGKIRVQSSMDNHKKYLNPSTAYNPMTIVNDYTPSRVGYNPPSRFALKTINQTQLDDKILRDENKSRLAPIYSRLNNSIDGGSINKIMSHEYDNMLGSKYGVGMRKDSITKSQRDLINQSHDLSLDIKQTRNALNPITGDMMIPSFSVKAKNGSTFGIRYT